jgi:hypothetical protein
MAVTCFVVALLAEAADGASIGAMVAASADGGRTWKDGAIAALSTALLTSAVFGCLSNKRKTRGGCDCKCAGCRTHHGAASSAEVVVFDADGSGGGSRTTIDAAADFLRRNAAEAKAAVPPVKAAAAAARLSRQQALEALSENTFTDDQLLFKTQVCRCARARACDSNYFLPNRFQCKIQVTARACPRSAYARATVQTCALSHVQRANPLAPLRTYGHALTPTLFRSSSSTRPSSKPRRRSWTTRPPPRRSARS